MPKGYWIAHVDVTDPENYPRYVAEAGEAFAKFGGRPIIRGGRFELPEGAGRKRHVVIEFDSYETALAAYNSPEYLAAVKLRLQFSESDFIIVEGV